VKRRLVSFAVGLGLVAAALTAVPILALRFVPPVTSAFMLRARLVEGCPLVAYEWTPRSEIAPAVFLAVLAAEDQRFEDHAGFDFEAIGDAIEEQGARGASTISQQIAKNLFLWPGRSWVRKGLEAWLTIAIEALWPKQRILEVYVNVAQVGRCTFGIGAASRDFFGKPPSRLGPSEAALLAAVLPNPVKRSVEAPSPRVRQRARWIERQARNLARPAWLAGQKSSH
jgi:monofunctional biosynthetic peptidoglycan transglycosylase